AFNQLLFLDVLEILHVFIAYAQLHLHFQDYCTNILTVNLKNRVVAAETASGCGNCYQLRKLHNTLLAEQR
ncbi:hypothetical protein, partial [Actinobacillus pleuropneumoniae]